MGIKNAVQRAGARRSRAATTSIRLARARRRRAFFIAPTDIGKGRKPGSRQRRVSSILLSHTPETYRGKQRAAGVRSHAGAATPHGGQPLPCPAAIPIKLEGNACRDRWDVAPGAMRRWPATPRSAPAPACCAVRLELPAGKSRCTRCGVRHDDCRRVNSPISSAPRALLVRSARDQQALKPRAFLAIFGGPPAPWCRMRGLLHPWSDRTPRCLSEESPRPSAPVLDGRKLMFSGNGAGRPPTTLTPSQFFADHHADHRHHLRSSSGAAAVARLDRGA